MASSLKGHETSVAADPRVHDSQMDRSLREIGKGLSDKDGSLENGSGPYLVTDVHEPGLRMNGKNDSFHHGDVGIAQSEIACEGYDS